jgi:uncharacterized protein (DUF924 family)
MKQTPQAMTVFWREAGPKAWFAKSDAFDSQLRERFMALHLAATRGEFADQLVDPQAALGVVLLLDQFPRNGFRDTPQMYASDPQARAVARQMIERGLDMQIEPALRGFCYLPFEHSETLQDQHYAVQLCLPLGGETLRFARHHLEIVERFGRFPHRNGVLGRTSTVEETAFLAQGGFGG